jgi:peptide/nickel transport system permease protein
MALLRPESSPTQAPGDPTIVADAAPVVPDPGGGASLVPGGPEVGRGRRRRRNKQSQDKVDIIFWLSVAWIVVVVFCALFASYLPIQQQSSALGAPRQGLSFSHPFGTDTIGNDLFSLSIRGARMAMIVAVASVAFGVIIGGLIGLLAGFFHGIVEAILMWLTDVMLAFPALVFALAIVSFSGASVMSIMLTIAILGIPGYARVARALTLTYAEQNFVLNARAMGAKPWRIMLREILPNVIVPLGSFAALGAALAIIAEGGLAFIGLSAPDVVDWGAMINSGRPQLYQAPQAAFAPMVVMFLTIVALNFIGERLGTALDPRQGQL